MIIHVKTVNFFENDKQYLTFHPGESGEVDLEDMVSSKSRAYKRCTIHLCNFDIFGARRCIAAPYTLLENNQ
jgi:hypothetical protein